MKCPICEVELESEHYAPEYGVNEEYNVCKNGCSLYSYQFAYGNSLTTIGSVDIRGYHTDLKEVREFHSKIQDMAIEHERYKLSLSLKTKECEAK